MLPGWFFFALKQRPFAGLQLKPLTGIFQVGGQKVTSTLRSALAIVKPEMVLAWHRAASQGRRTHKSSLRALVPD